MTTLSENRILHQTCPVCDSTDIHPALTPSDHTVSGESFEVWHCQNCSFRFTQNIPVANEIGSYYQSEDYISHSNTRKGIVNQLYQIVREITLRGKRNLIQNLSGKKNGRILDIGCGTGEFLGKMKNSGWETLGLEPDEGARNLASQNHGLTVFPSAQLFALENGTYDVITLWHVLEHVHELKPYIQKIHALLKTDGLLIIAVPNYQSFDAEKYGNFWAAYDVPRHLYHFSPGSMKQLLKTQQFFIREMRRMPFDAFYVSLLSEKYISGKMNLFSAFITGLRSYIRNLRSVEKGSSVLYVVGKR
ncbi:MAG: class I SAM-dependent methyltransferase [Bacteroidia bacterium]|nr:class I SAM-dependent methyltransferase [Bacteroidia bacterium]